MADSAPGYDSGLSSALLTAGVIFGGGVALRGMLRSGSLIKPLGTAERYIRKLPGINKLLPIYEGAEEVVRTMHPKAPIVGQAMGRRNLRAVEELSTLAPIADRNLGPETQELVSSALQGMARRYKDFGKTRTATLADVLYNPTMREKILSEAPDALRAAEAYQDVVHSGAGRAALATMKATPETLARRIPLSESLFVGGDKLFDVGRFTGKNIMERIFNTRLGRWKPFQLLAPTEFLRHQPNVAALSRTVTQAIDPSSAGGYYAGGKFFPTYEEELGGRITRTLGSALPGEFNIGATKSGMFRGAATRLGVKPGYGTTDNYMEVKGVTGPRYEEPLREVRKQQGLIEAIKEAGRRVRQRLLPLGERLGIGPQFASGPSRLGKIAGGLKDRSMYRPTVPAELVEGTVKPLKGEAPKDISDLTFFEKIQLKLGFQPKRLVSTVGTDRPTVTKMPVAHFAQEGTQALKPPITQSVGQHYIWPKQGGIARGVFDWLNYQAARSTWLLEEMTGMNIVPGKEAWGTLGNVVAKVALPAAAGASVLSYADYKMRQYELPGPIDTAAKAYTSARLGVQWGLDTLGITDAAAELEEQFPGLFESPLSKVFRAGISTMGGMALGRLLGMPIVGLAVGLSAAGLNMTNVTQSYEELKRIYAGEEKVPIRKSRWWFLGRDPFGGGEIDYYRQHWYPMMQSKYRDVSLYGSEKEAWKHGSWLPTPENLFGLRKLFDPYHLEEKQYWRRPYPVTGAMGAEMPIIGPWISRSRFWPFRYIKPEMYMHPEHWQDGAPMPTYYPGTADAAAAQLGTGYIAPAIRTPALSTRLDQLAGEQIYNLAQWSGFTGFSLGFLKQQVTGSEHFFDQVPQIADSNAMASMQREYHDKSLGGLLGNTEFVRRFIPRGRHTVETVNPIPNTMPDWLPGFRAPLERDRENYIDFHQGDAYTKIQMGEARLPGAGYEQLNRLHSGVPGQYDAMDRFLILADVSPFSDSFNHYKSIVESWKKAGLLDRYWTGKYFEAIGQMKERTSPQFDEPKFNPSDLKETSLTIDKVIGPAKFIGTGGRTYDLAGVESNVELQKWKLESDGKSTGNMIEQYNRMHTQLRELEGKTVTARIGSPGLEEAAPVIIPGLNEDLGTSAITRASSSPADAQARFGSSFIHRAWEGARHTQLPGPVGWPLTKFFGRRSAIEEYQMHELEGGDFAGWESPYKNFLRFWGRQTVNMFLDKPIIPDEVQQRRELEEYFDKLKYLKAKRLKERAESVGLSDLATYYQGQASKTVTGLGLDSTNILRDVWSAVPKTERKYFQSFIEEANPADRKKILDMSPNYMKPIYLGIWKAQNIGPHNFGEWDNNAIKPQVEGNFENIAAFFQEKRLPDASWQGWSPSVDLNKVRYKTIANTAEDFHDYDIWESQIRSAASAPSAPFTRPPRDVTTDYIKDNFLSAHERVAQLATHGTIVNGAPIVPITKRRKRKRTGFPDFVR